MHATFVVEEHHHFNHIDWCLGRLQFFRSLSLNVSVRKRTLQVGMTHVEQQGYQVGRKEYQNRALILEGPLQPIGEVVQNAIKKLFLWFQRRCICNSHNIKAKPDEFVVARRALLGPNATTPVIPLPICCDTYK
jgi:hypothetical protein